MNLIAFFDLEINPEKKKILDIGAIRSDDAIFHKNHPGEFLEFIREADYLCGHNMLAHDLLYLQKYKGEPSFGMDKAIDTVSSPFLVHFKSRKIVSLFSCFVVPAVGRSGAKA